MSEPWGGRPPGEAAERDGWHWVDFGSDGDGPWLWDNAHQCWILGSETIRPHDLGADDCYLGPCATPAEIAALRAERDRYKAALQTIVVRAHDEGDRIGANEDRKRDLFHIKATAREALGDE